MGANRAARAFSPITISTKTSLTACCGGSRSIDISRAREHDLEDQPDELVLQFAVEHGLLVLSHDVNTMTAAAYARIDAELDMPGLLMVRADRTFGWDHRRSRADLVGYRSGGMGAAGLVLADMNLAAPFCRTQRGSARASREGKG